MNENKRMKDFTIENAQDVLDRIIGFVGNCDQKAGFLVAASGLFVTFFVQEYIVRAIAINNGMIASFCPCAAYLYRVGLVAGTISFLYGEYSLMRALCANISNNSGIKSVLFFGDIKQYLFDEYKKKVGSITYDELLTDYVAQIYVNAVICTVKFQWYRKGFTALIVGCGVFIAFFMLGFVIRMV